MELVKYLKDFRQKHNRFASKVVTRREMYLCVVAMAVLLELC